MKFFASLLGSIVEALAGGATVACFMFAFEEPEMPKEIIK